MANLRKFARKFQNTPGVRPELRPGEDAIRGHNYPGPGVYNGYRCDICDISTAVIHRDAGVTPMFLGCLQPGCSGRSVSLNYPSGQLPEQMLPVLWEWYRPEENDPILKEFAILQHVLQGGLVLRQIRIKI